MFIPLSRAILLPYRLVRLLYEILRKNGWSDDDRQVLRWLDKPDDPFRPNDNRVKYFNELSSAVKAKKPVFLQYSGKAGLSSRKVVPDRLFRRGKHIYLEAFCLKQKEYRRFRLDRIKHLETENAADPDY